jgi:predicted alpha/beta-fold hydrolase
MMQQSIEQTTTRVSAIAAAGGAATAVAPAELFIPHRLLHSGYLQTMLALVKPRPAPAYHIDQPFLVDAGPDTCDRAVTNAQDRRVRLLAYYTPHCATDGQRRGLVTVLHGWQGCSHSNYNLVTTAGLTRAGFDVVRLNMRDHGPNLHLDSHALNPGLFLGVLIEEVHAAIGAIGQLAGADPYYLVGASMGGNFALRSALRHKSHPIPNLRKVIAINPALDPGQSTDNVDRNRFFRRYFRARWLDSLLRKQAHYPELYQFDDLRTVPLIRTMTERVVQRYGPRLGDFRTADEYFAAYTVRPTMLAELTMPTEIITSLDDPIIEASVFQEIQPHERLSVHLHPTGGHVGYVSLFPIRHHLPELVLRLLTADAALPL